MRTTRRTRRSQFSEEFHELARRIAEADGVTPLAPGELRPPAYYHVKYFTWGRKPLPPPKPRDER